MPDDNNNINNNPFIRFKNHINTNIQAGLNTVTAFSSHPASASSTSSSPSTTTPTMTPPNPDLSLSPTTSNHDLSQNAPLPTRRESQRAFFTFLHYSPYSPLRLAYHFPSYLTPTPHDLPHGTDPSQFGWVDAFEDLLLAASGAEMSDLQEKGRERGLRGRGLVIGDGHGDWHGDGHGRDGWGERCRWGDNGREWWLGFGGFGPFGAVGGPFGAMGGGRMRDEAAWARRMVSGDRGLMEVLFPYAEPREGYVSPRTMEEWVERRRKEREIMEEEGRWRRRRLEEVKRRAEEEERRWWEENGDGKRVSLFDEIGGVVKVLGEVLDDEFNRFGKEEEPKREVEKKKEPETETDLYSIIRSAFQESERSLSNFFKAFSGAWRDAREPKPVSPPKVETTETVENGITKSTTKKEFVDENGYTHIKVETTWKDEDGRVIFRQSQSSTERSTSWEKTFGGIWPHEESDDRQEQRAIEDGQQDKHETRDKTEQKKEGGWFWK